MNNIANKLIRAERSRLLIGVSLATFMLAGSTSALAQAATPAFAIDQGVSAAKAPAAIDVTASALPKPITPVMSVALLDSMTTAVRGQSATFLAYVNYPEHVVRSEVRISDMSAPGAAPIAILAVDRSGLAHWQVPNQGPGTLSYTLRTYRADGFFEDSKPHALTLGTVPAAERPSRPLFGQVDEALNRTATLIGKSVQVQGSRQEANDVVRVSGQIVPVNDDGKFSVQQILHSDAQQVEISVERQGVEISRVRRDLTSSENVWVSPTTGDYNVEAHVDGLVVTPVMAVAMVDSVRTGVRGKPVTFLAYNNYPKTIVRSEIRIFEAGKSPDSSPLAIAPVDANGLAHWTSPKEGEAALFYTLRLYDSQGRFDESSPHELTLLDRALPNSEDVSHPDFGHIDEAVKRTIPLRGVSVTVTGTADAKADVVRVGGQLVPVGHDGHFVATQIVDRNDPQIEVMIARDDKIALLTRRRFEVPREDWFVVGQGDLTLGTSSSSGPSSAVSGDPRSTGDYLAGRAAFYAKGVVHNDIQVTASVDTGETLVSDLFSNLDRKDPRQLLRRLNTNQYYPTYGDDSTLVEDAPTQGRFYLKVQKDASRLVVGNFSTAINGTDLAQLDRGLFGALADINSTGTTSFGERKTQVTAFASDPGTVPGRDEFRGTGGSLYFLTRKDVSVGSERLRVEVRDRETGIVLESHELHAEEDYQFDPFQGRVTLLKPLASIASTGETVRNGSSSGNVPVLVVRYEYTPAVGDLKGYTVGARATHWILDKIRLGATGQRDTSASAEQTLLGADVLLRQTAGTYLKAEVAQTSGPGFGQGNSVDGGLNFTQFGSPGVVGRNARAYRAEAAINFAELAHRQGDAGSLRAYYEHRDAGFSAVGQLTPSAVERWGIAGSLPIGANTAIAAKFDRLSDATIGSSATGTLDVTQKFGSSGVALKAGLRYEDRARGLLYNSTEAGQRTDAAVQLSYAPIGQNWSVFGFGQGTLSADASRRRNDRYGIGGKAELTERLSVTGEVSEGTGGLGADVQLNHRLGDGSEAYVGYSLFADRTDTGLQPQNIFTRSNNGTLTIGARKRFGDALSVNGEQRLGFGGNAPSVTRAFGAKFDPSKHFSISASFENGRIDDATSGVFKRTAATIGLGYTDENVRIGSSVEARFETGQARDQQVWLFRNNVDYGLNPNWHFLGRLNFAIAKQNQTDIRAADFVEGIAGFAYRPIGNERLNALVRFSYFQDLGPVGQVSGSGTTQNPKQKSIIGVIDLNYDLTDHLTIGAKYGYRQGQVSLTRDSDTFVSSDAHLGVIRLDYKLARKWDALVEGRVLSVPTAHDTRFGALGAIYRHINENVKIGAGYSLSRFSDDLTDQSYSSKGPFLNIIGKF